MFERIFSAALQLDNLLGREVGIKFVTEAREDLVLFLEWQIVDLFQNLVRTHGLKINRR